MKLKLLPVLLAAVLTGCASSDVTPLSRNAVQIDVSAAPVCGKSGARRLAYKKAAVETINRGYDKFIIADASSYSQSRVIGTTPLYVSGNYIYGGQPIRGGSHNAGLIVQMYRNGQAGSGNALDARQQLGPNWQTIVNERTVTC